MAQHLRWVIQEEKKYTVPLKPVLNVPQLKQMNVLGTQTSDVNELDKNIFQMKLNSRKGQKACSDHMKGRVREVCPLSYNHLVNPV